jgi:hypothetical protein
MYSVDQDYILGIVKRYVQVAKDEFDLEITPSEQHIITDKIIEHYIDHCIEYRVFVSSTDPFKFIAWMGLFFFHDIKKQSAHKNKYLSVAVAMMLHYIQISNKFLDIKFVQKLLKMAIYDKSSNKDHLAIGKNGLYMAFRCANMVQINQDANQ